MKALLVLDMQKGILQSKNFSSQRMKIHGLIDIFKRKGYPIILTRHRVLREGSSLSTQKSLELDEKIEKLGDFILDKNTPSAFYKTKLNDILQKKQVKELVITGFNTEYCCLFTSIIAFEKGYDVFFIEDATGSVNDDTTYEMPGLDINDFVGSVLNWSNVIHDVYYDEYLERISHE